MTSQRIAAWYNNHAGARNANLRPKVRFSRRNNPVEALLAGDDAKKPKQKLQCEQAFSVMFYESDIKSVIEKEWAEKLEAEPELKEKPGGLLAYRNMRIRQMYKDSTDAVKAAVEEFRKNKSGSTALNPLLLPHESALPDEEKENIIAYRVIKRYVTCSVRLS